jgi:hypothetical protein
VAEVTEAELEAQEEPVDELPDGDLEPAEA